MNINLKPSNEKQLFPPRLANQLCMKTESWFVFVVIYGSVSNCTILAYKC